MAKPVVQLLQPNDANVIISTLVLEPARLPVPNLSITQMAVEFVRLPDPAGHLIVTQTVIELIKSNSGAKGTGWLVKEA